jgi:hypothetical protein
VLTAEQLAREVAALLGLQPARVLWRVEGLEALRNRLQQRAITWGRRSKHQLSLVDDVLGYLARVVTYPHEVAVLATRDLMHPASLESVPALLALVGTGYVLDVLDADEITLVCPSLDGPA